MSVCVSCRAPTSLRSRSIYCRSCAAKAGWAVVHEHQAGAAYCDLCGRHHAGRWECVQRAERAAEDVRLWLYEGTEP